MMRRLLSAVRLLVSDSDAQPNTVEIRIALSQAFFIGAPMVVIGLCLMAALP